MVIEPPPNNGPLANYYPKAKLISAITNANPAAVTTTTDHEYITGIVVRVDVTPQDGMSQINQQYSMITVTGDTTFTMDSIDSTYYDTFTDNSATSQQNSQVVPIGEINSILTAATVNLLPL